MKAFILFFFISLHVSAHNFRLLGPNPSNNKFNAKFIGVAKINLQSDGDYAIRSLTTRHTHCFRVTTSSPDLIPAKEIVCSSTAGALSFTLTSKNVTEGLVELQDLKNSEGVISFQVRFQTLLRSSIKIRNLVVGQCTDIQITGGLPPYSFTTSIEGIGIVSGNKFCADPKKIGNFIFSVKDSSGQIQNHQMIVKGPLTEFSMKPQDWNILYGFGMPTNPTKRDSSTWQLDFPQIDQGILNYVTLNTFPGHLVSGKVLKARIKIETTPGVVFDHYTNPNNTSPFPAHVRFYIQRGVVRSYDPMDRWWSNPVAVKLEEGSWELRVSINPDQWTNMNGQRGNASPQTFAGFNRAIKEINQIGFTFGGGYFFGHGVRVKEGEASFILEEFEIGENDEL